MFLFIIITSSLSSSSDGLPVSKPLVQFDYGTKYVQSPLANTTLNSINKSNASSNFQNVPSHYFNLQTLNKFNVQEYITQRDIKRQKNATLKTYFAEILAASILTIGIVIFLCWWNCTKRGREVIRNISTTESEDTTNRRLYSTRFNDRRSTLKRGASMPEFSNVQLQLLSNNRCPKPACVCSTGTKKNAKGKRKWNYKEDNEPYGPAMQ